MGARQILAPSSRVGLCGFISAAPANRVYYFFMKGLSNLTLLFNRKQNKTVRAIFVRWYFIQSDCRARLDEWREKRGRGFGWLFMVSRASMLSGKVKSGSSPKARWFLQK